MPVLGYCRNLYSNLCPCFVCCKKFSLDNGVEDLLTHICFTHRIVIENIDRIADFKKYMEYYIKRYQEASLETFTKPFIIEVPENNGICREEKYYFLGDFLAEDEELRKKLHSQRLKIAQKQQKQDLSDQYYMKHCFFCHQMIEVTNSQLIEHLRRHGFHLGHPEKLVYIERFVKAIEDNFRNLSCLYCDVKFESCRALIKHLKERNHLKIHPNNRFYDQFYMINYVEFGKTWLDFAKAKTNEEQVMEDKKIDDDSEWSSWGTEPEFITCLFCKHVCRSWDGTLLHMQVSHNFDFKTEVSHLDFYHQVKMVNYVRKRIIDNKCINCDFESANINDLMAHMEHSAHLAIPDTTKWNHSDYYFSSMENDMFLYHLDDEECNDENEDNFMQMKDLSGILRHIDVENSENESIGSVDNDSCSGNNHETPTSVDNIDSIVGHLEEREIIKLKKDVEIKIKHWDRNGCMDNVTQDQVEYNLGEFGEHVIKKAVSKSCVSVAHAGAGDSGHVIPKCEGSLQLNEMKEFGDAASKSIL